MYRYAHLPAILIPLLTTAQSTSPKRGLCHVKENGNPSDDSIWLSGPSNPTWYYNYESQPSSAYTSSPSLHFVPMLWGASPSDTGTPFYDTIKAQLDAGANITHVLGFNEPDASMAVGGSNVGTALAAARWKVEIEPLKALGIKVGAPAVTGSPAGAAWMERWLDECGGGCRPDFMPVHWYGNFESMAAHIGQFGYPNQGLEETQAFWNMSARSFDTWPNITHYSYFGAFRSSVSNVGPNAAMLTQDGKLTSIGSWYMGGKATNNIPMKSGASWTNHYTYTCVLFPLAIFLFLS
ncbi:glycosyl hydrolase catalytic core-domain-containing protein [Phaeosphaeria sp. MPI-PUGE-AT-0046c]|nr:glycosyl hydrolase catalytic core-domain-containing protein [Phaeosphaeria sp. MPI-PUGE-AT-0046c]